MKACKHPAAMRVDGPRVLGVWETHGTELCCACNRWRVRFTRWWRPLRTLPEALRDEDDV